MKRMLWVCLLVFGLMLSWTVVYAADFYVVPVKGQVTSWDKKIPGATRWKLVLDGAGVLDKETGLVWEKSPDKYQDIWANTCLNCYLKEAGGRYGWRLPTIEELASLVDSSQSNPALPKDHPFTNVQLDKYYWSSTTWGEDNDIGMLVNFSSNGLVYGQGKGNSGYMWCVRGGYGHDGY